MGILNRMNDCQVTQWLISEWSHSLSTHECFTHVRHWGYGMLPAPPWLPESWGGKQSSHSRPREVQWGELTSWAEPGFSSCCSDSTPYPPATKSIFCPCALLTASISHFGWWTSGHFQVQKEVLPSPIALKSYGSSSH